MKIAEKFVYPAIIQQNKEGTFSVYFPSLFPDSGWEYPLAEGKIKKRVIENARKELATTLAGILYDNEELPKPIPINKNKLSKGMELIEIETSLELYKEEIQKRLEGRHWHLMYIDEETNDIIASAIAFKNEQGTWDVYLDSDYDESTPFSEEQIIFTVKTHMEAEEKFDRFVEEVILKKKKEEH